MSAASPPLGESHSIGILGGSFNPIHLGHLELARAALGELGLERVLLVPNALPPHKEQPGVSFEDRCRMVEIAISDCPGLGLCTIESDPGKKHYTFDTLPLLRQQCPPGTELFFIIGMDSLLQIDTWHRGLELINLCSLAVCPRGGYSVGSLAANPPLLRWVLEHATPKGAQGLQRQLGLPESGASPKIGRHQIAFLTQKVMEVSSTELRQALAGRDPTLPRAALCEGVLGYIRQRHLYGA